MKPGSILIESLDPHSVECVKGFRLGLDSRESSLVWCCFVEDLTREVKDSRRGTELNENYSNLLNEIRCQEHGGSK